MLPAVPTHCEMVSLGEALKLLARGKLSTASRSLFSHAFRQLKDAVSSGEVRGTSIFFDEVPSIEPRRPQGRTTVWYCSEPRRVEPAIFRGFETLFIKEDVLNLRRQLTMNSGGDATKRAGGAPNKLTDEETREMILQIAETPSNAFGRKSHLERAVHKRLELQGRSVCERTVRTHVANALGVLKAEGVEFPCS